ncbi:hypothetical protein [Streptomyces sp. 8N706]|uniref:hypothetical protein n=1 Tax=Streptomyces sp. 8N706 TaxID=3457416 RepID=UPI003FD241FD
MTRGRHSRRRRDRWTAQPHHQRANAGPDASHDGPSVVGRPEGGERPAASLQARTGARRDHGTTDGDPGGPGPFRAHEDAATAAVRTAPGGVESSPAQAARARPWNGGPARGRAGVTRSQPEAKPPHPALSAYGEPAQAFDALCTAHAVDLLRQTTLLTGQSRPARRAVERAFHQAWQRWPEVAADRNPAGWVRAAAYEHALSPWPRLRLRRGASDAVAPGPDGALFTALLALTRTYRRALLLHDGVGIGLPETAAEIEATTTATARRLAHAREAVAAMLPELRDTAPARQREVLHRMLGELGAAQPVQPLSGRSVRIGSERRSRCWTLCGLGLTALFATTVAFISVTSPAPYIRPETSDEPAITTPSRPAGKPAGGAPADRSGSRREPGDGGGWTEAGTDDKPRGARPVAESR